MENISQALISDKKRSTRNSTLNSIRQCGNRDCERWFAPKRDSAVYCSDACRVAEYRHRFNERVAKRFEERKTKLYFEWLAFDEDNPHVYEALKKMALMLVKAGKKRYGMRAMGEVLRYNETIKTTGDPYKINNNYFPLYARKMMDDPDVPEITDGFFKVRGK